MPEEIKSLVELKEAFDKTSQEMKSLLDKQAAEIKAHGETSAETARQIKAVGERLTQMGEDTKKFDDRIKELEAKAQRAAAFGSGAEGETINVSPGLQFAMSDEYKNARGLKTDIFTLKSFHSLERKSVTQLTSASNSAGDLVRAMRQPEIVESTGRRVDHIRSMLTVTPNTDGVVEYVEEIFVNNAAAQTAELAAKAESQLTFDLKQKSFMTVAHFVTSSRQVLRNAAMLRNRIDNALIWGILAKEDHYLLYGTGLNGEIEGFMVNGNVQDIGHKATGKTELDHLRRSIALARVAEYPVNAILLHPNNWADIELLKGTDDRYLWVNVNDGGIPRIWRVPIFENTAITEDDFLVGNFQLGCNMWEDESANIRIAEQHADLFIKNGVVILGEERVTLTIERPQAFVKGSFAPAA
jgi:HK97 family phage major capsid protein